MYIASMEPLISSTTQLTVAIVHVHQPPELFPLSINSGLSISMQVLIIFSTDGTMINKQL